MDQKLKHRISQLQDLSKTGVLGDEAKEATEQYENLPKTGMHVFLKVIKDFYKARKTEEDELVANLADTFCQLIIVVYRDAKKADESVAIEFAHSFIRDFPGVEGSCVYPQWEALAKASYAFKAATNHPLLAWQQSLKLVQAYNEFLNALLGYLLVTWRCALGKSFSTNVFSNTYGSKLNEFSQLTGGEDGAFYLIFRLAKPKLRNAIAHEDIWLDKETNKVRYTDGRDQKITYEMDLTDFLGYATVGSHFAQAYIVAISAIIIFEEGSTSDIAQLPFHLVKVFQHNKQ